MAKIVSTSVLEFSVKGDTIHVRALKKSGDAAKGYAKSLGILSNKQNITFRNSRNLHKANKKLMGSFSVLRSKLLLVGFATAMFTKTIGRLISASNEQELAERKLSQALTSTGRATEFSSREMKNFASGLQKVSTFGDETIIKSQALLATFTSVGKDVFPDATRAILDVSAAMGQDLQQTTIQVGKALNDPMQGMTALRRVGIQLSDAQEEQIKKFTELNDVASAQKIILGELETQFGGMAKAITETSAGALLQMKNALGDTAEALGDLLAPAVINIAKTFTGAAEAVTVYLKNLRLATLTITDSTEAHEKEEILLAKISRKKTDLANLDKNQKTFDTNKKALNKEILALEVELVVATNERKQKEIEAASELAVANVKAKESFSPLVSEQKAIGEIAKANAEIFKNNLDFQLMQIDLQAEKYRQMKLDEVAIDQFANDAKKEIALQHLEDNNAIYEASFAGYDAFVNTLVDTDMTGTERRTKAAEAFKNSLIKFGAEMLKDHIKNMVVKAVISKTGESAAIASALMSGKAIASAYAVPASLASTASFGASAVTGQAALVASIAATKAISSFAQGGDFVTNGAQLIMVGDNPGGKERVQVTPLSSPSARQSSGGGGVTVNITGGVVDQDYVRNELIPALNRATGTGSTLNA